MSSPSSRLASGLAALSALVLAAAAATPVATQGDEEWALGLVHHLPPSWQWGLGLGAVLLLLPPLGDQAVTALGRLGAGLEARGRVGALVFVAAISAALWCGLSAKAYYTLRLGVLDFERAYPTNLGSNALLQAMHALVEGWGLVTPIQSAKEADLAFISWLCSLPWALACWCIAGRLTDTARRLPIALLLLATPATALVAGHREIYFVPGLAVLLTAWAAVADLQEERLPWRTSLAAGFAVSAHLLAVAVLPLWAWVLWRGHGRPSPRLAAGVLPALGLWLGLLGWLWWGAWGGMGPPQNPFLVWGSLAHLDTGHGGLFWTQFDPQSPSGFLSPPHQIEWLNLVLFLAPQTVTLVLVGANASKHRLLGDPARSALLALAAGALAVSLLDRPFGGHLYQWAHNANVATSAGLLAAALWTLWDDGPTWRRGCAALLALGAWRTVGFIALNHMAPPF